MRRFSKGILFVGILGLLGVGILLFTYHAGLASSVIGYIYLLILTGVVIGLYKYEK